MKLTQRFVVKNNDKYVTYPIGQLILAPEDYRLTKKLTHAFTFTKAGVKDFFLTLEGMKKKTNKFTVHTVNVVSYNIAVHQVD